MDRFRLMATVPRSGSSRPAAIRSRVVLPAPFGPTRPIRSPSAIAASIASRIDERADLAADAGESQDRHQRRRDGGALAAARRVAAARLVRSVRARGSGAAARPALTRHSPRPRAPSSADRAAPGHRVIDRRIVAAPFRSAAGSRWQNEQKCVDRAPMTIRRMGRPQRGQGPPVRW